MMLTLWESLASVQTQLSAQRSIFFLSSFPSAPAVADHVNELWDATQNRVKLSCLADPPTSTIVFEIPEKLATIAVRS